MIASSWYFKIIFLEIKIVLLLFPYSTHVVFKCRFTITSLDVLIFPIWKFVFLGNMKIYFEVKFCYLVLNRKHSYTCFHVWQLQNCQISVMKRLKYILDKYQEVKYTSHFLWIPRSKIFVSIFILIDFPYIMHQTYLSYLKTEYHLQ